MSESTAATTHDVTQDTITEGKILNTNQSVVDSAEHHEHFLHHLTLPNRRMRTLSETERIAISPTFKGVINEFCRNKGYGFIKPEDGSEPIFVHISDIEGEWCPKPGDIVSFKKSLMPPKMQKYQAVHVHFVHLKEGKHEHWDVIPSH